MSRLTVWSIEGLTENSNVISVPTGHSLNVADAGGLQIGGSAVVSAGLVFISRTTIGTAVSSVTVSDAFSADYDNYKIVLCGGQASAATSINFQLGSEVTGYLWQLIYGGYGASVAAEGTSTGTVFSYAGSTSTSSLIGCIEVQSPFLAKRTFIQSNHIRNTVAGICRGFHNAATSFTDFTLSPLVGTFTGGTIDVYGYTKA